MPTFLGLDMPSSTRGKTLKDRNQKKWGLMIKVNHQQNDGDGVSSAFLAVKRGNLEMLQVLVQHGADLKPWYKMTGNLQMRLLHVACKSSNAAIVDFLISQEEDKKNALQERVIGTNSSVMHLAA
jgi:hypothetical protein